MDRQSDENRPPPEPPKAERPPVAAESPSKTQPKMSPVQTESSHPRREGQPGQSSLAVELGHGGADSFQPFSASQGIPTSTGAPGAGELALWGPEQCSTAEYFGGARIPEGVYNAPDWFSAEALDPGPDATAKRRDAITRLVNGERPTLPEIGPADVPDTIADTCEAGLRERGGNFAWAAIAMCNALGVVLALRFRVHTWGMPPVVYFAAVARPGEGKSAPLKVGMAPMRRLQAELWAEWAAVHGAAWEAQNG